MGSQIASDDVMVSIILTSFNHEKYLAQAIDGILSQTASFTYEIVIGDDASTDNSVSIIMDFANRFPEIVIPIIRTLNLGGSKNFTDLFRRCRGKYITFIDGDDFWTDSNKLQTQYDYLEDNHDVFSVSHKVRICDSEGNSIGMVPSEVFIDRRITIKDILKGERFALTATMMRAIYDQDLDRLLDLVETGPRNAGDLTIALYLLEKGSIPILNSAMSVYRYRSTQGDTNYNSITKLTEKIYNRVILLGINDDYFSGKYYFGWMYIRLAASAGRGLVNCKPLEFMSLFSLILKISMLFIKTSLIYALNRRNTGK